MITFQQLSNHGRLGNQLFQIASTIGLAVKHNNTYAFNDWKYNDYFVTPLSTTNIKGIKIKEPNFHYCENILSFNDDTCDYELIGYFQSEKYFKHCKDVIKKQFTFNNDFIMNVATPYKNSKLFDKPVVAIHIRRGDYVNNSNYAQLPITYYYKALIDNFNLNEVNILIFSDDIEYCKLHFKSLDNVYYSENNSDIEDLCLMTFCDHFIISNSTYSWWGAYLGEKENSIVIRPEKLFDNSFDLINDSKDFYQDNWVMQIENKLDLSNVTFCIPIILDSHDRYENLHLCLKYLRKYFNTNIIVTEEINNNYIVDTVIKKLVETYKCFYMKVNNKLFHRTKMLNDMFKLSSTSYVANWDCDVFISPIAIHQSIENLKNGAIMSFPYDGTFERIPRVKPLLNNFSNTLDLNELKLLVPSSDYSINSVGGAVIVNREEYLKIGGENENFISFGAEDSERVERVLKLNKKLTRVKGSLYHINHWVGINSSTKNPHFLNNRDEYKKVVKMTKEELNNYIKTWTWI